MNQYKFRVGQLVRRKATGDLHTIEEIWTDQTDEDGFPYVIDLGHWRVRFAPTELEAAE